MPLTPLPVWVKHAISAMASEFGVDLWRMRPEDRTAILLAALDAETVGTPAQAEILIAEAVEKCWTEIKAERRKRSRRV